MSSCGNSYRSSCYCDRSSGYWNRSSGYWDRSSDNCSGSKGYLMEGERGIVRDEGAVGSIGRADTAVVVGVSVSLSSGLCLSLSLPLLEVDERLDHVASSKAECVGEGEGGCVVQEGQGGHSVGDLSRHLHN